MVKDQFIQKIDLDIHNCIFKKPINVSVKTVKTTEINILKKKF